MDDDILVSATRLKTGKGAARETRRQGYVPAIIYGKKHQSENIKIKYRDLAAQMNKGRLSNRVITIDNQGQKHRVIARELHREPASGKFLHIDFLLLEEDDFINFKIPVLFINEDKSEGLKRGGTLNIVRREIELNCPVRKIPENITVDLAGLNIGASIHISMIKLPENVSPTITDRDFTIATIAAPSGMQEKQEETEETEDTDQEETKE